MRDGLRGIVAVVGTLTIAWLGVAWFLGLSVIVLSAGSMTTAAPSGSVAIVQRVEASNLTVGDVVSVPHQKAGTSVTRRIIDIETVPRRPDVRSLTLRGDTNAIEVSGPYVLTEADRVLASSPHAGALFVWVQSPGVLLGASLLVAGATAWVLWPPTGRAGVAGGRETADG
jgi:hypothetical protein